MEHLTLRIAAAPPPCSRRRSPVILGLLTLWLPALSPDAFAQGTLCGAVRDPFGAELPGVEVSAADVATGTAASVKTDRTGNFRIDGLPAPGRYELTARLSGFQRVRYENVALEANQTGRLNFTLRVGQGEQTIDGRGVTMEPCSTLDSRSLDSAGVSVAGAAGPPSQPRAATSPPAPRSGTTTPADGSQALPATDAMYSSRARRAVEDMLRRSGQPVGQFRFDVLTGGPSDHVPFHAAADADVPDRAQLSGRVLDRLWEPVMGARVSVRSTGPGATDAMSVTTGADGRFQISGLTPGANRIEATTADGTRSGIVNLRRGDSRVLVPMADHLAPHHLFVQGDPPGWASRPFAQVRTLRGATVVRTDFIEFDGLEPRIQTRAAEPIRSPFGPGTSARSLSGKARDDVIDRMTPFLEALFDIARGPSRFDPFLSSRLFCRAFTREGRGLPSIGDRRCAQVLLESLAILSWHALEGLGRNPSLYPLFNSNPRYASLSDEAHVLLIRRANDVLLDELTIAGMLDPEHSGRVQDDLRNLAAGWITEVTVERGASTGPLPFPAGILYTFARLPIALFLSAEEGQLRVRGVVAR